MTTAPTPDQSPAAEKAHGPASYFPSIEKKYGHPVEHWTNLVRERCATEPRPRHSDLVAWLKAEHGLGHGHANALVKHTLDRLG